MTEGIAEYVEMVGGDWGSETVPINHVELLYSETGFSLMKTDTDLYFEFDDKDGDGITHGCSVALGGITIDRMADLFKKTQVWMDA